MEVYEVGVQGFAHIDGGVVVKALRCRLLLESLPQKRSPSKADSDGDSVEEESDGGGDSDAVSRCPSVDTDVDSRVADGSEEEGWLAGKGADAAAGADIAAAGASDADTDAEDAATGAAREARRSLWSNGYFYIADNEGNPDVKVRMHNWCATEVHMGHWQMSKTITPATFGESRDNPTCSVLLLRAWALWRARLNNWADLRDGRSRQFASDAADLVRDISAVPGHLLGHPHANRMLRKWAPYVAESSG